MNRSEKVITALTLFFAVFKTAMFVWSVPLGFDSTDESFLINGYKHWNIYNTFDYFRVLNLFFDTTTLDVTDYRWLRIVTEIFSVVLLTGSFYRWQNFQAAKQKAKGVPLWLCISCCSIAVFQSVIFRMLSYNDVVYLLLSVVWSLLLLSQTQDRRWPQITVLFVAGFLTGFMFFIKPSAAILQTVLLLYHVIIFYRKENTVNLVGIPSAIFTGTFVWLCFYPGLNHLSKWLQNFLELTIVYRNLEYTPVYLAELLLSEIGAYVIAFSISQILFELTSRLLVKIKTAWLASLLIQVFFVLIAGCAAETVFGLHSYHRFLHYSILVFITLFYNWGKLIRGKTKISIKWLFEKILSTQTSVLLIFMLLHFVITLGSLVSFSEMFYIFQTPALLVFASFNSKYLNDERTAHRFYTLFSLILGLMIFNFIYFNILHSYGLPQGLFKQTQRSTTRENLKLDKPTEKMYEQVQNHLRQNGFSNNKPVIALDYLCGVAYMCGGYQLGCPCYVPGNQHKMNFNCGYLRQVSKYDLPDTVAVLYTNEKSIEVLSCLPAFPAYKYQFVDSVFNAYSLNPETKEMMGQESSFIKIGLLTSAR